MNENPYSESYVFVIVYYCYYVFILSYLVGGSIGLSPTVQFYFLDADGAFWRARVSVPPLTQNCFRKLIIIHKIYLVSLSFSLFGVVFVPTLVGAVDFPVCFSFAAAGFTFGFVVRLVQFSSLGLWLTLSFLLLLRLLSGFIHWLCVSDPLCFIVTHNCEFKSVRRLTFFLTASIGWRRKMW